MGIAICVFLRIDPESSGARMKSPVNRAGESIRIIQGGCVVDHICVVFPILSGKTQAAREFQRELSQQRMSEYDKSERRIGITKEDWFIASVNGGDQLVAYMEANDFNKALTQFVQSRDSFDMWFKERLADVTGVDLNNPPPGMKFPELVSTYEA